MRLALAVDPGGDPGAREGGVAAHEDRVGLHVDQGIPIDGVSCPTTSLCVAVDFNGDAWVANRAHDSYGSADPADAGIHHQSSATKIANKNNSINDTDCIDRNHNGKIDTSYDADGDGIINTDCNADGIPDSLSNVTAAKPCVGTAKQEFFGLDDECIAWNRDLFRSINDSAAGLA